MNSPIYLRNSIIYLEITVLCIIANITAFIFQFFFYELPCPLCLLQRFGLIAIGLGAYLSIVHRPSWKYNLIIILSSTYTLMVGLRQVLLHITANDPGYGSTFLGLHFYTWSAIISFLFILLMSAMSVVHFVISKLNISFTLPSYVPTTIKVSYISIILINIIFTFSECGIGMCPDNPTTYEFAPINKLFLK